MNPHSRGLALLLSLGSLPLACTIKDDTDSDDGTGTTGTNTTPPATGTTSGTTGTEPTTGTTDNSGTMGTMGTTGTDDTGTTGQAETSTSTQPTSDTGSGGPDDPICVAYGNHYADCFPRGSGVDVLIQECEDLKSYYAMPDGPACVEAFDAYFVCLTNVDCADLMNEESDSCTAENQAILTACPSLDGETTTDSGASESTGG